MSYVFDAPAAPSLAVAGSSARFPVHRIWELNQPQAQWDSPLELYGDGVRLLILRRDFEIQLKPLPDGDFAMLRSLSAGQTLASAYAEALRADREFQLAEFIQEHVTDQTLVDFRIGCQDE